MARLSYNLTSLVLIALITACGAQTKSLEVESAPEAISPVTFDVTLIKIWEKFETLDASLKSSVRENSTHEGGIVCESTAGFGGELSVCNFGGLVTEVGFQQFAGDLDSSDDFANAMISFFETREMPYTDADKTRIKREFREYSKETPPLKFPHRWVAINGKFVKITRVISSSKSGFEAQTTAGVGPL